MLMRCVAPVANDLEAPDDFTNRKEANGLSSDNADLSQGS